MKLNFLNLGIPELFILLPAILWVLLFVLAFVKCVTNSWFSPTEKAIWVLVICLAPFFGAIAYLAAYRKRKKEPIVREY